MSTLRIDNFAPSAGGTGFGTIGIAKALANYDQDLPSVRSSENVSSVGDDGAGLFTVNFTNAFADALYCLTGSGDRITGGNSFQPLFDETGTGASTTNADMVCFANNLVAADDNTYSAFHGDLA